MSAPAPDLHISQHLSVSEVSRISLGGFCEWMADLRCGNESF